MIVAMLDTTTLRTIEPRSQASATLRELLDELDRLRRRLDQLAHEERRAHADAREAATVVADLERAAAIGENPSVEAAQTAERALAEARQRASQAWPERRRGIGDAIAAAEAAVQRHVSAYFGELTGEVADDARGAAERVNAAAEELVAAHRNVTDVERRLIALLGQVVSQPRPNSVTSARCELVVQETQTFLMRGGEIPPAIKPQAMPVEEAVP
jgi:hypothetical protein